MARTSKAAAGRVTLAGELTIERVAEARDRLRAAFAADGPLTVDVGGVTRADLAGHQLLCSVHRTAHRAGRPLTFVGTVPIERTAFVRPGPCPCATEGGPRCRWEGN